VSFVKSPSGDQIDLELMKLILVKMILVKMIRIEPFCPGGPRCTVVTKLGDLTVIFDTIREARDWMDKFGQAVSEFKARATVFHSETEATDNEAQSS
jgi:hypothetical protein